MGQRPSKRFTETRCRLPRAALLLNPVALHVLLPTSRAPTRRCTSGARPEILVRRERTPARARRRSPSAHWPAPVRARRQPWPTRPPKRTCCRPQGARRARDADRPGAQRHRPHRQDRQRQGHEAFRWSLYSHVGCIVRATSRASWIHLHVSMDVLRGHVPGRHLERRAGSTRWSLIDQLE